MLEWLLWSFLPSIREDSHTFSSGFCFFSLPRGFVKQHHIEVMPVLKSPGQGCSGACRDHAPPWNCGVGFSIFPLSWRRQWPGLGGRCSEVTQRFLSKPGSDILRLYWLPSLSQADIFPKPDLQASLGSLLFSLWDSAPVVSQERGQSLLQSCGDFLPSSSNPDLQLLVL